MAEVKKASAIKGMKSLEEFGLVLMHCVWLPVNADIKFNYVQKSCSTESENR